MDDGALHAQGLVAVASVALAGAMGFMAVAMATAGVRCAVRVAVATCSAMERSAHAAGHIVNVTARTPLPCAIRVAVSCMTGSTPFYSTTADCCGGNTLLGAEQHQS